LKNNIGVAAKGGFIPKGMSAYDPSKTGGYTYDKVKASQLLAEAGFPNGEGMTDITLFTTAQYLDLCTFVASNMDEVGIRVNIEMVRSSFLRELKVKQEAAFFRSSWIADYPDEENYLSNFYGNFPAPPNYTGFKHPLFDSLYLKSLNIRDKDRRIRIYQMMDSILVSEAPIIPLYYDEVLRLVHHNVEGLENNPMNLLVLKRVRIVEQSGSKMQ
ncbi:MAG: ABC transporter substrate-binding protein, partial [Bacteroidetes bacterium]|nr:ABC transporter substrate-binding protein [Bacteroidota bacterium]